MALTGGDPFGSSDGTKGPKGGTLTNIKDQWGNTWVDDGTPAGYWINPQGAVWNPNSVTADNPGGTFTYDQKHFYDGPQGPGYYNVDQYGNPLTLVKPDSSGGGGGGGSMSPTNVYISQNPGNLYRTVTSDGSDGFPAGTVYQVNGVTGDINIQYRPPTASNYNNPLDKNNDGLNDSTGWANGVFKDSSSPSGFYYTQNGQYVPVTPDGAPYNGPDLSGGGANAKTWTGQGPKGYGTYYLDGAGGTPGTFIGDTRAPSAAASSGTPRPSTSGGSSSSGSASASAQIAAAASAASDAARAAQQAAHDAWQGNQNDADRNWKAAQAAIDRAVKLAGDRAQFELTRTGLVQDQTKMLLDGAKQFADLVSSTDPIKYRAFLEANGGNVWAGLANGQTAVSDNANLGAARTLRGLENPTHIPTWDEVMAGGGLDVTNPPTVGATGVPIGYGNDTQNNGIGNTGTPVGGAAGSTGTTGGTTGGTTNAGGIGNAPTITIPDDYYVDPYAAASGKMAGGVSRQMESRMPGAPGNWDLGAMLGVPVTAGQRGELSNLVAQNWVNDASAAGQLNYYNWTPYLTQAQIDSVLGKGGVQVGTAPAAGPDLTNSYNTANTGATHIDAATGRLVPGPGVPTYNASQVPMMPTGQPATDPYWLGYPADTTATPPSPYMVPVPQVSRFAQGGVMVGGGMAVTGDSHNGRPNEEMVVNLNPDPHDRIAVIPMDRIRQMGMGPAMQSVIGRGGMQVGGASMGPMRMMPRAADGGVFGADSYLNPVTPEDQPYLDRVQAIRDATDFSNWNPFRADYFQADPTIRDANEKAVQAARGIPQASLVSYAQRYALPGIQRGALRIGV